MANARTIPDKMHEMLYTGKEVTVYVDGTLVTFTPEGLATWLSTNLDVQVEAFTTAGGTEIAAGSLQTVLEAIADLADPAV